MNAANLVKFVVYTIFWTIIGIWVTFGVLTHLF